MKKFIRDLFTDRNDAWDLAAIVTVLSIISFLYFAFHAYIVLHQPFSAQDFGMGIGGLSAGAGAHKLLSNKGDYGQ